MRNPHSGNSAEHGIARPVQVEDLALVRELLDEVFRRSRGVFDQSQLTDFPLVFSPANLVNNRLIVEDGIVVSHAALWPREYISDGQRFKVAVIASVATNPNYRNRGYAATLMRSLQQQLHEESYDFAVLWTSVPDFYVKLGWRLVTPRGVMTDLAKTSVERLPAGRFECLPLCAERHVGAVLKLYDENPIRLSRDPYQAERLFCLPKVPVWVATREGQVAAYVCHGRAINKQGIAEYGGELEGIVALLRHIVQSLPDGRLLPLILYHTRPDLIELIRTLELPTQPLPSSKGTNHEMVYVVQSGSLPPDVCDRLFIWGLDHA